MKAVFVTATGTDVGKTFLAAGLIHHFRRKSQSVDAFKPVVSGYDPAKAKESDTGVLLAALGHPIDAPEIERISPWRFSAPLSPDLAAKREGRHIDFTDLVTFSQRALGGGKDMTIIEGVGGIMVPLDERHTVLDWMKTLRIPALLVAGSYLGTISHTLSALDVLLRHDVAVAAIVVSETPGSGVSLADTVSVIARFAKPIEVVALPRLQDAAQAHPAFERIAHLL